MSTEESKERDNDTDRREESSTKSFFGESMEEKSSEKLKEIYRRNDQTKWSPSTFEEIRSLLKQRGEEVPEQKDPTKPGSPNIRSEEQGRASGGGNTIANFLDFKKLITTRFIKGIYLLGALIITVGSFFSMSRGGGAAAGGFFAIIIGNIVWRIICENLIVLFDIHDTLTSIDNTLDKMD